MTSQRAMSSLLAVMLSSILTAPVAARDKTDVVVLRNGDRITGEIQSLEFGLLRLNTSRMGKLSIEWPSVMAVASEYGFHVERIGGRRYFGTIQVDAEGTITVRDGEAGDDSMPMLDVMRLSQVEGTFWNRIDGTISLGLNYTRSSGISTGTFALNSEYRSARIESSLTMSAQATRSPGQARSDRYLISNSTRIMRPRRNFWVALSSLERNEELGIDGRLQLGAAIGRHFRQRSSSELTGLVGLSVNQEWVTGSAGGHQSVEGVLGGNWRIFRFSDPETTLESSLLLYPGITESGRRRSEFNLVLGREVFADFSVNVTFFNSYDSDPPDASSRSSDYGIVTGIAYKF